MRTMSRVGTLTDNGVMESINGWAKAEMFVDFRIGESEDVPKAVVYFFVDYCKKCLLFVDYCRRQSRR